MPTRLAILTEPEIQKKIDELKGSDELLRDLLITHDLYEKILKGITNKLCKQLNRVSPGGGMNFAGIYLDGEVYNVAIEIYHRKEEVNHVPRN